MKLWWERDRAHASDEEKHARLLIESADILPTEQEDLFEVIDLSHGKDTDAFRSDSTIDFGTRICGFEPTDGQKELGLAWYTPQQEQIWKSVEDHANTIVFSGNGIGKTLGLSIEILARFYNGYAVVTTAPVRRQVDNLWSEIRRLRRMAAEAKSLTMPGRWSPRANSVEIDENWTLSGYTAKVNAQEAVSTAFAGKHYSKMFGVMDELVGVKEPVWEAMFRILTDANAKFLGAGNPTEPTSYAAKASRMTIKGVDGIIRPMFNVIHLSSEDHPNVIHGRDLIPGATSRKFCDMQLAKGGSRDSAYYRTSVLGLFPNQGQDALIRSEWIEAAKERGQERVDDLERPKKARKFTDHRGVALGMDVAGEGTDLTVLMGCDGGKIFFPRLYTNEGSMLPCWHRGNDHTFATRLLVAAMKQIPRVMSVSIDDTGLGAAVSAELWKMHQKGEFPEIPIYIVKGPRARAEEYRTQTVIQRCNFGSAAPPGAGADVFPNLKSWLWWNLREHLRLNTRHLPTEQEQRNANLPPESDLFAQLLAPRAWKDDSGNLWVLDKRSSLGGRHKQLTEHLPSISPDIAHAVMLASDAWEALPERVAAPETTEDVFEVETRAMIAAATNTQRKEGTSALRPFQRRAR